jgi:GT2 family glycosyltransferase
MDGRWLRRGPPLACLVAQTKDQRKSRKRETALIIPTYQNPEALGRLVDLLGDQTLKEFDIIIVYGEEDGFLRPPPWASVLHMREGGRNGCAGGYYIGQCRAMEEGYRNIIFTDDDCTPESDFLLHSIVEGLRNNDVVLPKTRIAPLRDNVSMILHHYGGVRREVLEKAGLTYFPLYIGGEDLELMDRIRKDGTNRIGTVEAFASHPMPPSVFTSDQRRALYYARGNIMRFMMKGSYANAAKAIFLQMMMGSMFFVTGRPELAGGTLKVAWDARDAGLFRDDGIEAAPGCPGPAECQDTPRIDVALGEELHSGSEGPWAWRKKIGAGSRPEYSIGRLWAFLSYYRSAKEYLGKSVLFLDVSEPLDFAVVLMAGRSFTKSGDRIYSMTRERDAPSIALGLFFMALCAPAAALASLLLAAVGIVNVKRRGISSLGYRPEPA